MARVLVVDDYEDTLEATVTLLDLLGHVTAHASTGAQALSEAHEFRPDIVLLDISLPDASGYDVARVLRQVYGDSVYLAAVTGWARPEDRVQAMAAGFDRHVAKPASMVMIRSILIAGSRA